MPHNERSRYITQGIERSPNRVMFYALGYTKSDLDKPIIGVANGYSTITPCNAGLQPLADAAVAAIRQAGANPQTAGTPTISDGMAMCTEGMKYGAVLGDCDFDPGLECLQELARGSVVEAPLAFLEEQVEVVARDSVVSAQVALGLAPEVLDAVDVASRADDERLLVIDPVMAEAGDAEVALIDLDLALDGRLVLDLCGNDLAQPMVKQAAEFLLMPTSSAAVRAGVPATKCSHSRAV